MADAGLASRRGAETWIREGRVTINGRTATLGESVDPEHAEIHVDGEPLRIGRRSYWLLHKPRGVLSTTRDPHARASGKRTVLELLPRAARARRLYPVGRLDLYSEGLLLLTNDGETTQALLHPSLGAEKEYLVTVKGELSDATARKLARGPRLADGPMAPCRVGGIRRDSPGVTTFTITLQEGRKHQIRRALLALGHPVMRLKRIRMGPLKLGRLEPGRARELRPEERRALLAAVRRLLKEGPRRVPGQGAARPKGRGRGGSGPKAKAGRPAREAERKGAQRTKKRPAAKSERTPGTGKRPARARKGSGRKGRSQRGRGGRPGR